MDKFGRNYSLVIQNNESTDLLTQITPTNYLTVQPPFTMEFDITRNSLGASNVSSIRVFNLNANSRNSILKNQFEPFNFKQVFLNAGYGPLLGLPNILTANVTQSWSVREGTNYISQIESLDGGYAYNNATFSNPIPSTNGQTTRLTAIQNVAASLSSYGVQVGAISPNYSGTLPRGNSYSGTNSMSILKELTGGEGMNGAFIDNGTLNCLKQDEYISGAPLQINSASGLLGTPIRQNQYLTLDMLFEPAAFVGQQAIVSSTTGPNATPAFSFNGSYRIVRIHHRGTISEAVCGEAITSLTLVALSPAAVAVLKVFGL